MEPAARSGAGRAAAAAVLCAAVLAVPALFGAFAQYFALNVLLLMLLALSFNLLFGMTGLLSFGHAAFYAAGAYSTALLLRAGAPLFPAVIAGALCAAVLAAVVGAFCVRHTRVYFSMLTLAFGMFVYAIVWKWTDVTGGDDGLVGIPRTRLGLPGPIVGAVVYLGLKELIVRFTEYWLLVFGLVLLGVVLAFRGGLLGAAEALLSRRPWMSGPRTPAAARKDAA